MLRYRALGPVQAGQEDAVGFTDPVGDHRAILQLEIERGADEVLRHLKQAFRQGNKLGDRQAAMALVHRLGQRIGNPGAHPHYSGLLDAELHRNGVGGLETDAADVARKPVRILGHDPDGVAAVGLENAHRARRADAMAVQEDHDFPHRFLLGPRGKDAGGAHRADALDLPQPVRRCLDDVEYLLAKRADQFLGVNRADTADHAGCEVFLDAAGGGRRRRAQKPRLELLAMGAVVDPFARRRDPLAGGDRRRVAHHRDGVAMSAGFRPQHAEAVLGIVIGHALNEPGQHFLDG